MNILYYIPYISQEWGGVRQYAAALLKILAKDTSHTYFVYHEANDPEILEILFANPQLKLISKGAKPQNPYLREVLKIVNFLLKKIGLPAFKYPNAVDKICKKYSIDIIHCPYQFTVDSRISRTICTMHDVQELHFPEFFTPEERAYRASNYLKFLKNADRIIVSYQHIKQDLIKYFDIPPENISVCLLDMDQLWVDRYNDSHILSLDNLQIPGRFLFYPANTWQHKNHIKLLEALVLLREQGHADIKLVCTGHKTQFYYSEIQTFLENRNLTEHVSFLGIVDERVLYTLYKTCVSVVVPTKYEAGSFPLMESLLLEVPVICANTTSLPETIGNLSFVFQPDNADDIADKIAKMWHTPSFRTDGILNSKERSYSIRNNNALNTIKNVYAAIVEKRGS